MSQLHVCPTCHGEGVLVPFAPDVRERGLRLKAVIASLGLTQGAFASRIDISEKHLSQLIHGASEGTVEMWQMIDAAIRVLNASPSLEDLGGLGPVENEQEFLDGLGEVIVDG